MTKYIFRLSEVIALNKLLIFIIINLSYFAFFNNVEARGLYGERFCNKSGYYCVKVKRGDTWKSLFPDREARDVVQRLNRMNVRLQRGIRIAVPRNLRYVDVWDIAPFSSSIDSDGEKSLIIDQSTLAWGAYDESGSLQAWGPISPGRNYCPDVGRACRTITGTFRMYTKRGPGCVSSKYPVGVGGAKMPHCMFFYRGYALHGSPAVPGYPASHGCIRLFNEDAKWLYTHFIDLSKRGGPKGTKVIIRKF